MKKFGFCLLIIVLFSGQASAALKTNDAAPDFSLPDLAGKKYSLADLAAGKNDGKGKGLVLSFFASWCMPCRNELPVFNRTARELNDKGITVAIVNIKEKIETVKALLAEVKVDKPIVLSDADGRTAEKYQVRFLPVTFIIGNDGRIKDMIFGEIAGENELRKSAEKLLK